MTAQELVLTAVVGGSFLGPIIVAAIKSFSSWIEEVFWFLVSFVIVRKKVRSARSAHRIITYLGYGQTLGTEVYDLEPEFVRPLKATRQIWWRKVVWAWRVLFVRGWPMLYLPSVNTGSSFEDFLFLRGTVDFEEILRAVEQNEDDKKNDRTSKFRKFSVYRHFGSIRPIVAVLNNQNEKKSEFPPGYPTNNSNDDECMDPVFWTKEELGEDVDGSRIEDLSLNAEQQETIDRIRQWYAEKDWYREHGVPWRKGVELFGGTGCGKSTFIRATCEELDIPCHMFDLASMNNEEFLNAWQSARNMGEVRAVAFEDIDTVFDGRDPVNPDSELTFDIILNAIDGVQREDGLLLFITTNHVEKIDPALGIPMRDDAGAFIRDPQGRLRSTRPGRIDIILEVRPLEFEGRLKLARRILGDETLAQKLALEGDGETATQFQDKCVRVALDVREANR